jgi:phage baseplate assembly protein W
MDRSLSFPFQVTDRGVAASSPRAEVLRQQLEQLLLTLPGERVNRPDFGCGIQRLVFAGASPEAAAAAEYVIASSIRRHLRDLLQLDAVRVTVDDTSLFVDILYTVTDTGQELAATFAQPLQVAP